MAGFPRGVEIGNGFQPIRAHLLGLVVERHRRAGQVIENRLQAFVIERQPMLHAGAAPSGADRFIKRVVLHRSAEFLAVARTEPFDHALIEQHLVGGAQFDRLQRPGAALAERVEAADVLDHIAEEIEP